MKQSIYQLFVPLFFLLVKTQETTKNVNADYTDYTFSNPDQCTLIQADPGKVNKLFYITYNLI